MQVRTLFLPLLFFIVSTTSVAQIPKTISYQGRILDAAGKPIPDGLHKLSLTIRDSAGSALWGRSGNYPSKDGIFSIELGPFDPAMFTKQYFLSVKIEDGDEMGSTPLLSAPYAFRSAFADVANGVSADAKGVVTSINESDGAIRIVGDSTVGITQNGKIITLHAYSVGPGGSTGIQALQSPEKTIDVKFSSGPLSSIDIRDSSITAKKIVNGAITAVKLNQSGATQGQILKWNGSVWAPDDESGGSSAGTWRTGGNSGTVGGTDFLGTIDSQSLDLRTKNIIMLRLNANNSIQRDGGGNTRGIKAIDLQASRSVATQVASGNASVIGGGEYNTASGQNAVIAGGVTNISSNSYTTVGGGGNNSATNTFGTVAGGGHNTASGTYATIAGGQNNAATGSGAAIGGGVGDTATAYASTIAGGTANTATGTGSTISGGANNFTANYYSVVAGGTFNRSSGYGSTSSGGIGNIVLGDASSISGGFNNFIQGDGSTIAGGAFMRLKGSGSFAFHNGSSSADSAFVTADSIAYFGNTNLWLANTNNKPSELRFYEAQNGGIVFPNGNTNYTSFKAGSQTSNILYTLPTTAAATSGMFLTSSTAGILNWSSNAIWDATNARFGANTTSPNTTIDANGDLAMREHPVTIANGINNNVAIGSYSFILLTGANAAFSITGLLGGVNGKMVIIYNTTGQVMTITNNDPLSVAANRIFTPNIAGYTTPAGAQYDIVTLIYSPTKNGWVMVSHN